MLALLLVATQAELVAPRTVEWAEMVRTVFDPTWILPGGLPLAEDEEGLGWELGAELPPRVSLVVEPSPGDPGAPRSFGDLAVLARGLDPAQLAALLERVERAQPELWRAIGAFAGELLRDDGLRGAGWDPGRDCADDGLLMARPLTLEGLASEPWKSIRGSRFVQQAAAFVRADAEAIKAAENDYTRYTGRAGTSYESIEAVEGSYLRGLDPAGRPFAALAVRFESDLPFPFSSYECDLRILNRLREDGRLTCDIASPSRDFHWMAGRDLFVPVFSSDGAFQGELVVRLFGFDLRGVPDGDDARRGGLRASLGSLKREAEELFRGRAEVPLASGGQVPDFRVLSPR